MLLASVSTIREGLGFDDMPDINSALTQGLNSAEPFLASRMNMRTFARATSTDIFWVEAPTFRKYPMVHTVFRLSSGLLTQVQTIVRAPSPTQFASGDAVALTGQLQIDLEKGVVSDFLTDYDASYVRFEFEHGFELEMIVPDYDHDNPPDPLPSPVPTGSYKLDQVPDWLQQAATLQALILTGNHPAFKNTNTDIDVKAITRQLDILMANHIRYAPTAILPL